MADDWFRSPGWSADDRTDFEQRLGRARSYNRPQYLRIKGLALAGAGDVAGAREVWLRVLELDVAEAGQFRLQAAATLEYLGDSYVDEDPRLAEQYYRRLLAENPTHNGTTQLQQIKLAELLLSRGRGEDLREAEDLLVRWTEEVHSPFPTAHFRWNLAAIRLSEATGDRDGAREAARRALKLADLGPVFPRHKTVGIVDADRRTLKKLRRLAK